MTQLPGLLHIKFIESTAIAIATDNATDNLHAQYTPTNKRSTINMANTGDEGIDNPTWGRISPEDMRAVNAMAWLRNGAVSSDDVKELAENQPAQNNSPVAWKGRTGMEVRDGLQSYMYAQDPPILTWGSMAISLGVPTSTFNDFMNSGSDGTASYEKGAAFLESKNFQVSAPNRVPPMHHHNAVPVVPAHHAYHHHHHPHIMPHHHGHLHPLTLAYPPALPASAHPIPEQHYAFMASTARSKKQVRKSAPKSKTDAASSKKSRKKSTKADQVAFDPADEARLDAAIRSVNNKYGEGDERVKKLAVAILRGVTMRPSGKWVRTMSTFSCCYFFSFKSRLLCSLFLFLL